MHTHFTKTLFYNQHCFIQIPNSPTGLQVSFLRTHIDLASCLSFVSSLFGALDAMQNIDDTTIDCSSMLGKKHWLDVKKGVVTGVHILGMASDNCTPDLHVFPLNYGLGKACPSREWTGELIFHYY